MFRTLKIVQERAYIKEFELLLKIKTYCKLSTEAGDWKLYAVQQNYIT